MEEKSYWRNQNIWDNIKQSNMQVTGVQEEEERYNTPKQTN